MNVWGLRRIKKPSQRCTSQWDVSYFLFLEVNNSKHCYKTFMPSDFHRGLCHKKPVLLFLHNMIIRFKCIKIFFHKNQVVPNLPWGFRPLPQHSPVGGLAVVVFCFADLCTCIIPNVLKRKSREISCLCCHANNVIQP